MANIKFKIAGVWYSIPTIKGDKGDTGSIADLGGVIAGLPAKTTPVDADSLVISDSASANVEKKLTWTNIKATLKTYFDTLYNNYVHPANHPASIITQDTSNRFVTDAEKTTWNSKMNANGSNSAITTLTFSNGTTLTIDADRQTANYAFPDGTTANLPSELWYAEGKATEAINEGDNCMFAGSQGNFYLIKKAVASELALEPHLYAGVATKSSAINGWVKVTKWGLVNNINTSGFAYGTKLYFNPATLGFTDVLPALPNARIYVGMVVRQGAANGILLVEPKDMSLYTNAEIDTLLSGKANSSHSHSIGDITGINLEETIIVSLSDETTAITAGAAKATFRMPYACKLTTRLPRASVNTASSSGVINVDINKNGTSILTNRVSIDASEKTSLTAATAVSLATTPTTFSDDDEITFDIDNPGTGAKGLKVTLFVERT